VAGDDITTDRPGGKYLWLMCVRERTKLVSCKVRDVDGSSSPFVMALKSSITNRTTSNFSICKKHISLSFSEFRTFIYLFAELLLLSQNQQYDAGIEVIEQWFVLTCLNVWLFIKVSPHSVSITS
jgi:hypothetical protein